MSGMSFFERFPGLRERLEAASAGCAAGKARPTTPGEDIDMLNLLNRDDGVQRQAAEKRRCGDARKALRWNIEEAARTGGRAFVEMTVTPETAAIMLERNTGNRQISKGTVARFVAEMTADRWTMTAEAIKFSKSGVLLDGQHRLTAIVQSGRAATFLVVFGLDDEVFHDLDQGKKRGAADMMHIAGVPNAALAAAILRMLIFHRNGSLKSLGTAAGISNAVFVEEAAHVDPEKLHEAVKVGSRAANKRLCSPAAFGALYFLCAEKSKRDADRFFDAAISGQGGDDQRAAVKFRNELVDIRLRGGKAAPAAVFEMGVRGWNAFRQGKWKVSLTPQPGVRIPGLL